MKNCKVCNLKMQEIQLFTSTVYECGRCNGSMKSKVVEDFNSIDFSKGYQQTARLGALKDALDAGIITHTDIKNIITMPKLYSLGTSLYFAVPNVSSATYILYSAETGDLTSESYPYDILESCFKLVDEFLTETDFDINAEFTKVRDKIAADVVAQIKNPWLTKAEVMEQLGACHLDETYLEQGWESDVAMVFCLREILDIKNHRIFDRYSNKGDGYTNKCIGWRIKK